MPAEAVDVVRYWPFAAICAFTLFRALRLLLRERMLLRDSVSYLGFLGVFLLAALAPNQAARLAHLLGFTLLANFLFASALIALALLHLRVLIAMARVEQRTVELTQELALLDERVQRSTREP